MENYQGLILCLMYLLSRPSKSLRVQCTSFTHREFGYIYKKRKIRGQEIWFYLVAQEMLISPHASMKHISKTRRTIQKDFHHTTRLSRNRKWSMKSRALCLICLYTHRIEMGCSFCFSLENGSSVSVRIQKDEGSFSNLLYL